MAHDIAQLPGVVLGTRNTMPNWKFKIRREPQGKTDDVRPAPAPTDIPPVRQIPEQAQPVELKAADVPGNALDDSSENGQFRGSQKPTRPLPQEFGAHSGNDRMGSSGLSALDIYIDHFGLKERPFSLVPDPEFIYWSPAHQRAYTMLEYGILTRAPITLITGDVGAGKTTLVHHLLKTVGEGVRIGMISNAHGSRGELLRWVLMSLDQPADPAATYVDLFATFQTYLIEEYAAGNRVILIFDEAQNLSRESLEELRMFTNINANKDELLQLVLVGQPELREMIHRPDLRQFAQRVSANFHLTAMDAKTTRSYIKHRLHIAGTIRNPFSKTASDLVHQATGGVPRLVNQLCDLSMVYAYTKGQTTIAEATVRQVLDDGVFFSSAMPARKDDMPQ